MLKVSEEAEQLLNEGLRHFRQWRLSAALFDFEEASKLDPESAKARTYFGMTYLKLGHPDAALRALKEAARIEPENAEVYARMATAFWQIGDPYMCQQMLERARRLSAPGWFHDLILAELAVTRHQNSKALRHYRLAKEGAPNDPGVLIGIGTLLLEMGQNDEARSMLDQVVRGGLSDPDVCYNLGVSEIRLRHYSEAYAAFQAALDLDPYYVKAMLPLAHLDFRRGKLVGAWKRFVAAISFEVHKGSKEKDEVKPSSTVSKRGAG